MQCRHRCIVVEPTILGEFDFDYEVQVPLGITSFTRHTLSCHLENLIWLEDTTARMVNVDSSSVEVFQHEAREAAQSFGQGNLEGVEEVIFSTSEGLVFPSNEDEDDVARILIGHLIGFALQNDPIPNPGER